jgi:5-methylcytosine-specific restriction endonuclease McrA
MWQPKRKRKRKRKKKICDPKNLPYQEFLLSPYWQIVRAKVLERDKNTCQECGSTRRVVPHHYHYAYKGRELEHLDCLITLCKDCHTKKHSTEPRWIGF